MVRVKRVDVPTSRLLDPAAEEWRTVPEQGLSLAPTPLASQLSAYVQAAWQDQPYGVVPQVTVQAAHDGESLFFRLSWPDETRDDGIADTDRFTDAAAVLFPLRGEAPLTGMGSPEQPVSGWYWRPDYEEPFEVTAQGLGTSARRQNGNLTARAAYGRGGWSVVVAGPLGAEGGPVGLRAGQTGKVAFAVWQGANGERAGLKAATLEWQPLEVEE